MFSISVFQRKVFYVLLSIAWGSVSIYSMFNDSFVHGLEIMIFGTVFILSIALIQSYMIRMIQMYDKNLKTSTKKSKNTKKQSGVKIK